MRQNERWRKGELEEEERDIWRKDRNKESG